MRKLAKLGEIKLKQIQQLNTADSSLFVRKHKEVLNLMMRNYAFVYCREDFFLASGANEAKSLWKFLIAVKMHF